MWILGVLAVVLAASATASAAANVRVLSLSDLHLNLLGVPQCYSGHPVPTDPNEPYAWCDSPPSLVEAAVAQASCAGLLAVLVPGDVVRHAYSVGLTEDEALKTFSRLHSLLDTQLGGCGGNLSVPILAVGNNDMLPKYPSPPKAGQEDPWLVQLSNAWPVMRSLSPAELSTFRQSGFYSVDLVPKALRVLVLHTNYWTRSNGYTGTGDPVGGFAWISQQLARAQADNVAVWLLGHIPPGVDHFSKENAYHEEYATRYFDITGAYYTKGVIKAAFFGHEHTLQERNASAADQVLFMQGSVSPDKGNNPSLRTYSMQPSDYTVVDMNDVYWDLKKPPSVQRRWASLYNQSSFAAHFNLTAPFTLSRLLEKAVDHPEYLVRQYTKTPSLCSDSDCSNALHCDVVATNPSDYYACIALRTAAFEWQLPVIIVGSAVLGTLLGMALLVFWRWRRTRITAPDKRALVASRSKIDWGLDDPLPAGDEFDFKDDVGEVVDTR